MEVRYLIHERDLAVFHSRVLKILKNPIEMLHGMLPQKSHRPDQCGDAPCCECTSREAGQVDQVTMGVVVGQKAVGLTHIFRESSASAAANQLLDHARPRTDARLVEDNLRAEVGVFAGDGAADASHVGRVLDFPIGAEPGAVVDKLAIVTVLKAC